MIQAARSSTSQSLLRELETAQLLINDGNIENFFNDRAKEVIEKRRNPEATLTGAKSLRDDLLAYLEQQGEVKTANVWCRKIKFLHADELLKNIKTTLAKNGIQGVVELHLQDREINSPHIQFVGNNVNIAEELIANEILKMNFEDSFESAVSRMTAPAYLEDKGIRVLSYDDRKRDIETVETFQKEQNEREQQFREKINSLHKKRDDFLSILGMKKDEVMEKIKDIKQDYSTRRENILNNSTDELLEQWKQRLNSRRK